MRILHVANFNLKKYGADLYATDRKISAGLIRCGHAVYDFSYRDICRNESPLRTTRFGGAGLNRKLIKACDNLQPDILLLGHSELITKKTLAEIRHSHPTMRVGLWYVDALFHREKASHILARRELIDVLFATTGGELLKEYGPGGSRTAFIPNMVDNSVETGQAFARTNWNYDFLFCGRDGNDLERRAFIQKLYDETSSFLHPTFRGCLGQPPLTGAAYIELLSQTRMGLNLSRRNDVYLYSSDRLAQLLGNGLLTFCPRMNSSTLTILMTFSKNCITSTRMLRKVAKLLKEAGKKPINISTVKKLAAIWLKCCLKHLSPKSMAGWTTTNK